MKYNLVIGLDISKSTLDASQVRQGSPQSGHDSFLNNELGFKHLLKWIRTYRDPEEEVLICLEHTGHYAHQLLLFLQKHGFEIAQINPLKIKRSMGLRREKSDKADSKAIALYGLRFQEEINFNGITEGEYLDLQLLLAHRKRIQEKKLSFQRQEKYLTHCFSDKCAKTITKDLKRYKKYFDKELKRMDGAIDEFMKSCPSLQRTYDLLQTIPGIGRIISLYTILYTKNFEGISSARKFACYSGVAPFKNESGSSVRKGTRVSFYANRKMKGMLTFGAMNAVKADPQLKAYYQRKTAEKVSKMLVLNAVRNKLIHRMYAVIRRGTPYVPTPVHH